MTRICIIHNDVGDNPPPDDLDTLAQAALVYEAVKDSCDVFIMPVGKLSDLNGIPHGYTVFNLVEDWMGDGYEAYRIPQELERRKLAFTGAGSGAMMLTGDKVKAKAVMSAAGISTPATVTSSGGAFTPGTYIIKPSRQSGSKGIDENAVINAAGIRDILTVLSEKDSSLGYFAEEYIDGREISVSLLAAADGVRVLPPREMIFDGFGRYKILDYSSKWDENSKRYQNTVSETMSRPSDAPLIKKLTDISAALWTLFGLRGWTRVDFRVDGSGKPFVLEVNCNPCLTPPDSSFYLAAQSAGLNFKDVIGELIAYARF